LIVTSLSFLFHIKMANNTSFIFSGRPAHPTISSRFSSDIPCGSSGFTAGICETSSSWGPIHGPSASRERSK
jgi:hypothetical protein